MRSGIFSGAAAYFSFVGEIANFYGKSTAKGHYFCSDSLVERQSVNTVYRK